MSSMFAPPGFMGWKLYAAKQAAAADDTAPVEVTLDPPALRLASVDEEAAVSKLHELARRCGVGDDFLPLLAAINVEPGEHYDVVIANGIPEQPALIALSRSGVTVVDPSRAIPGSRTQVVTQRYAEIQGAELTRSVAGGRRLRWFNLEATTPVTIELSKAGAEAASQVVHLISKAVDTSRRRHEQSVNAAADR